MPVWLQVTFSCISLLLGITSLAYSWITSSARTRTADFDKLSGRVTRCEHRLTSSESSKSGDVLATKLDALIVNVDTKIASLGTKVDEVFATIREDNRRLAARQDRYEEHMLEQRR